MKWVMLFVCLTPTLIELWNDKDGESKKDKVLDTIWLLVAVVVIAGGAWWLGYRPLPVIGLIIGWRILLFDYLINIILYRRKVIQNPGAEFWFSYTGQTARWDKLISKVHPWVRLIVRLIVFSVSLIIFAT